MYSPVQPAPASSDCLSRVSVTLMSPPWPRNTLCLQPQLCVFKDKNNKSTHHKNYITPILTPLGYNPQKQNDNTLIGETDSRIDHHKYITLTTQHEQRGKTILPQRICGKFQSEEPFDLSLEGE